MKNRTRERLETLMAILAMLAIALMAMTDPIVAHWIADTLLELAQ